MSADFTPEKEDLKILTPFKMQVLTNFPYIEADFDALTNYQLLCKVVEYLNNVITNENKVTEQVTGLYNAYVSLQNYVNTYFDNLDLQSIVDNKLDEMAEDGTLADMIAEYIKMQGQLVYNSVADMKAAENIQNGSFLKTYGYYEYNDGGGALYKARPITNEDVIDNMTIIALHDVTLVAELIINDSINIKSLGAKGDNSTNNYDYLLKALSLNKNILIPNGDYIVNGTITLSNKNILITGETDSNIKFNSSDNCFTMTNSKLNIKNINFIGNDEKTSTLFNSVTSLYNLENCNFTLFDYVILQETCTYDSIKMNSVYKCIFDNVNHGIRYYGNEYVNFNLTDSSFITTNNGYFIANCEYAKVIGGTYTSTVDATENSCNLYSNNSASIEGGYYHDMRRGATIGGRVGKSANIIGTINKNISYAGLSLDLATGETPAYTIGYCSIIGNVIENARYGMYMQCRNTVIANNFINVKATGEYGIRLNCTNSEDSYNIITNNIINAQDNACNAIYLGDNTIATVYNNKIYGTNVKMHGGSGSYFLTNTEEVEDANYDITPFTENVIFKNLTADKTIYVKNETYSAKIGQRIHVFNNDDTSRVYIGTRSSNVTITGASYIPAQNGATILCVDRTHWYAVLDSTTQ